MQQKGYSYETVAPENKYLNNGKELNEDYGMDLYEYGFRWYDAAIGRFTGVDPIADEFAWVNTYNYAENEPVANIDLHGLQKYRPDMKESDNFGEHLKNIAHNLKEGTKTVMIEFGDATGISSLFEQGSPNTEDFHDHGSAKGGYEEFSSGGDLNSEGTAPTASAEEGAEVGIIEAIESMFPSGGGSGGMSGIPDEIQKFDDVSSGFEKAAKAAQEINTNIDMQVDTTYVRDDGIKITKSRPRNDSN
ncbi:MAG: hypothetical protein NXI25_23175 [bacterium]|nr:hypothetical protein [bacterium]